MNSVSFILGRTVHKHEIVNSKSNLVSGIALMSILYQYITLCQYYTVNYCCQASTQKIKE